MKNIDNLIGVIIIFSFISITGSIAQNIPVKNDTAELGLKGNVSYLKETSYDAELKNDEIIKGKIHEGYQSTFHLKFDKKGNKIEDSTNKYNLDSNDRTYSYKYDSLGNKVEKVFYTPDGNINMKYVYSYDDKGNLINESEYFADGLLANRYTYLFDERGNLTEYNDFLGKTLDKRHLYVFDENGNEIEWHIYNSNGELERKWERSFDSRGNMTKEKMLNSEGKLTEKSINKYDKDGNKTDEIGIDSEGRYIVKIKNKYDNQGHITESNFNTYLYGNIKGKNTFTYDKDGNLTQENLIKSTGKHNEIRKVEYKYDDNKNWIEQILLENEIPKILVERIIEYHDSDIN